MMRSQERYDGKISPGNQVTPGKYPASLRLPDSLRQRRHNEEPVAECIDSRYPERIAVEFCHRGDEEDHQNLPAQDRHNKDRKQEIRDTVSLAPGKVICCSHRERDYHFDHEEEHEKIRVDRVVVCSGIGKQHRNGLPGRPEEDHYEEEKRDEHDSQQAGSLYQGAWMSEQDRIFQNDKTQEDDRKVNGGKIPDIRADSLTGIQSRETVEVCQDNNTGCEQQEQEEFTFRIHALVTNVKKNEREEQQGNKRNGHNKEHPHAARRREEQNAINIRQGVRGYREEEVPDCSYQVATYRQRVCRNRLADGHGMVHRQDLDHVSTQAGLLFQQERRSKRIAGRDDIVDEEWNGSDERGKGRETVHNSLPEGECSAICPQEIISNEKDAEAEECGEPDFRADPGKYPDAEESGCRVQDLPGFEVPDKPVEDQREYKRGCHVILGIGTPEEVCRAGARGKNGKDSFPPVFENDA